MMAGENWPTEQRDVESLKARVLSLAPPNDVATLKDLCLTKIVDHVEFFCKASADSRESLATLLDKQTHELYQEFLEGKFSFADVAKDLDVFLIKRQEPFKELPTVLMDELRNALTGAGWCTTRRVLPCMVESNTKKLSVDMNEDKWGDREKNALLARIRDKGQNIQELKICNFFVGKYFDVDVMKGMFQSLTKLTSLSVNSCWFDDSSLAIIGSNCPELRHFSSSLSTEITSEGLRYLCDSSLPRGPSGEEYGKCKKLTSLHLGGGDSEEAVVTTLTNLPDLVLLYSSYLFQGIVKLVEADTSVKLKLQRLDISYESDDEDEIIQNDVIASVVSAVPDVRKLKINCTVIENIDSFMKLKHVNVLSCGLLEKVSSTSLQSLISHFCNQLTELKIDYFDDKIDITVIGFHCRQLQKLYWDSNYEENGKYKLVPLVHFNKLEKAELNYDNFDPDFHTSTIPDCAVECILSSPNLQLFSLSKYPVHDNVFQLLIKQARLHPEIFFSLQTLNLTCEISPLNAKKIICLAPKLTILTLKADVAYECSEFTEQFDLNHCKICEGDNYW